MVNHGPGIARSGQLPRLTPSFHYAGKMTRLSCRNGELGDGLSCSCRVSGADDRVARGLLPDARRARGSYAIRVSTEIAARRARPGHPVAADQFAEAVTAAAFPRPGAAFRLHGHAGTVCCHLAIFDRSV